MKVKNQRWLLQMAAFAAFGAVSLLLYANLKNVFYLFNLLLIVIGFLCSFALLSIPILRTFVPDNVIPFAIGFATFFLGVIGGIEIPVIGVIAEHQHVLHHILTVEDFRRAFIFIPFSPLIAIFCGAVAFKKQNK